MNFHYIVTFLILCLICSPQAARRYMYFRNRYIEITPRIVKGVPAKLGDFPYQISFKQLVSRAKNLYASYCGGALITERSVVSAAHCFETKYSRCLYNGRVRERDLEKVLVVAGNLFNQVQLRREDSLQQGQFRRLLNMSYPTNYDFPRNDISVGFVKKPFVINSNVKPIPFATKRLEYKERCLASGYGRTTSGARSKVLLWAYVDAMPSKKCSRLFKRNMKNCICVDSPDGATLAKGDSGGPLACVKTGDPNEDPILGVLVGVTSGRIDRLGSFCTRVSSYSKFIAAGIANITSPDLIVILFLIHGLLVLF